MYKTRKMVLLAILLSMSLMLHYFENMLPPLNILAPGAKLGLSNIINLTCLYVFGFQATLLLLFMRVFLSSTFYGGMSTFMYSVSGGVCSILAMEGLKRLHIKSVSVIGISMVGSFFFNIGQLFVAALILSNGKIFYYLPWISIVSIGTGIFVGLVANFIIQRLEKILKEKFIIE